jgi:hypothetical protein
LKKVKSQIANRKSQINQSTIVYPRRENGSIRVQSSDRPLDMFLAKKMGHKPASLFSVVATSRHQQSQEEVVDIFEVSYDLHTTISSRLWLQLTNGDANDLVDKNFCQLRRTTFPEKLGQPFTFLLSRIPGK